MRSRTNRLANRAFLAGVMFCALKAAEAGDCEIQAYSHALEYVRGRALLSELEVRRLERKQFELRKSLPRAPLWSQIEAQSFASLRESLARPAAKTPEELLAQLTRPEDSKLFAPALAKSEAWSAGPTEKTQDFGEALYAASAMLGDRLEESRLRLERQYLDAIRRRLPDSSDSPGAAAAPWPVDEAYGFNETLRQHHATSGKVLRKAEARIEALCRAGADKFN